MSPACDVNYDPVLHMLQHWWPVGVLSLLGLAGILRARDIHGLTWWVYFLQRVARGQNRLYWKKKKKAGSTAGVCLEANWSWSRYPVQDFVYLYLTTHIMSSLCCRRSVGLGQISVLWDKNDRGNRKKRLFYIKRGQNISLVLWRCGGMCVSASFDTVLITCSVILKM